MPFIPYNIINHLAKDDKAEDLWKLLKYNDENALRNENLTLSEKLSLLCKNNTHQNDYNVFLTRLIEDGQVEEKTILKVYKLNTIPSDNITSICLYAFDILTGAKTNIVDYKNYPCSRLDVIENILVSSLNGVDVNGVGLLQFNRDLNRMCGSTFGIGNNTSYIGTQIIFAVRVSDIDDNGC